MTEFSKVSVTSHPGTSGGRRGLSNKYRGFLSAMRDLEIGEGIIIDPVIMEVDADDSEAMNKLRVNVASAIRRHLDDLKEAGWRFRVYFDRDDNLIAARVAPVGGTEEGPGETSDFDGDVEEVYDDEEE